MWQGKQLPYARHYKPGLVFFLPNFHFGCGLYCRQFMYSKVPIRGADRNKQAGLEKNSTLPDFLLSKLINEQGGIFCLLGEKLRAGWKKILKI